MKTIKSSFCRNFIRGGKNERQTIEDFILFSPISCEGINHSRRLDKSTLKAKITKKEIKKVTKRKEGKRLLLQ
jgi:hypothetical protein